MRLNINLANIFERIDANIQEQKNARNKSLIITHDIRKDFLDVCKNINKKITSVNIQIVDSNDLLNEKLTTLTYHMNGLIGPFLVIPVKQDSSKGNNEIYINILIILENYSNFTINEKGALILHDIMIAASTSVMVDRYVNMFSEIYSAAGSTQTTTERLSDLSALILLFIGFNPFRNPYFKNVPMTGVDETISNYLEYGRLYYNDACKKILLHDTLNPFAYIDDDGEIIEGMENNVNVLCAGLINRVYDADLAFILTIVNLLKSIDPKEFDLYFNNMAYVKKILKYVKVDSVDIINESTTVTDMNLSASKANELLDIRYEIDKLSLYVANIEYKDQKSIALYRSKNLKKHIGVYLAKYKSKTDKDSYKIANYLTLLLNNLEALDEDIKEKPITLKKYGVFTEYPDSLSSY